MGKVNFSEDFKREAVRQITERGLYGCGGFAASGRQPAFALRVDEEVLEAFWFRRG
jgi:hypothetical protein